MSSDYYLKNRDRILANARKRYAKNKPSKRLYDQKYWYDNRAKRLLQRQANRGCPIPPYDRPELCELCSKPPPSHKRRLSLDHDHKTGTFRGWLCSNCNTALGLFKDNPILMRKAALYLERFT